MAMVDYGTALDDQTNTLGVTTNVSAAFYFNSWTGGSLGVSIGSPNSADIVGNWVHFAVIFDGTARKLYANGLLLGTDSPSGKHRTPDAGNLTVGANIAGSIPFHGLFDDIKIYNYARTREQIAAAVFAGNGNQPVCMEFNTMDFDGDCEVNFFDFADFSAQWLIVNIYP